MMWTYQQKTGAVLKDGKPVAHGYSGFGMGKNNPEMEQIRDVGPIPRGTWRMVAVEHSKAHGPYAIRLEEEDVKCSFGRAGFLIHGESFQHPGMASHGCIILQYPDRVALWESGDRLIEVI